VQIVAQSVRLVHALARYNLPSLHGDRSRLQTVMQRLYVLMNKHCAVDVLSQRADPETQDLQQVLLKVNDVHALTTILCVCVQTVTMLLVGHVTNNATEQPPTFVDEKQFAHMDVSSVDARTLLHHCDAAIIGRTGGGASHQHAVRAAAFTLLDAIIKVFEEVYDAVFLHAIAASCVRTRRSSTGHE
jgi:hypothetical protein